MTQSDNSDRVDRSIAIVGVSLRFPGDIQSLEGFWSALEAGTDLITAIPPERWATDTLESDRREEPGRTITHAAGVLSDIDRFDPAFFGLSPREAETLDPQQRLTLELAWQAAESAGIPMSTLSGTDCGMYLGISSLDYGMRMLDDLASMTAHSMTGNTMSVAANRVSYVFDLHGPSFVVDTACSSSLVALHQACESLRRGESRTAFVGGVNLLLHPYSFIGFTQAHMISAGGRCRPFADGADGYVRAEGGAMLLLKPLAQAQADGDTIHAVIRATGNNTDGGRKNGLTIPSTNAQEALLTGLLDQAGLEPDDIDYVEAHGTGTAVGDPAEAQALANAIGRGRQSGALPIGSVKSNLGHMEAAAGMAGLIKALLVLRHRRVVPTLHAERLNRNIDWAANNLEVVRKAQPLPALERPLRAGINSFGFGGANAHAILEAPPGIATATTTGDAPTDEPSPWLFLSTRSEATLPRLAAALHDELIAEPEALDAIAWNAVHRREWLSHRVAITGDTRAAVIERLGRVADNDWSAEGITQARALSNDGRVAFVFGGNGSQWPGMGQALAEASPTVARTFAELEPLILEYGGFSLAAALAGDDDGLDLARTAVAQPLIFAVQVGVARLLAMQGIEPEWVMGHSVGEVAAAWAAGIYDLDTAAWLVCQRSAAQQATQGHGRMLAVNQSWATIQADLARLGLTDAWLECAAVNAPDQLTLAGDPDVIQALADDYQQSGRFARELPLDYAFHSAAMDPIRDDLLKRLEGLSGRSGPIAFVSSVTGEPADGPALDPDYWWRNVREPVAFERATGTMLEAGGRILIEIGPEAILQRYLRQTAEGRGIEAGVLATLSRRRPDAASITATASQAHLLAGPRTAQRCVPASAPVRSLPPTPFDRASFWMTTTAESYNLLMRRRAHPLLGYRLKELACGWENPLDATITPVVGDHCIGGATIMPAAGYAEMAIAAGIEALGLEAVDIDALEIRQPLVLEADRLRVVRTELDPDSGRFVIRSRPRLDESDWREHARGRILGTPPAFSCPPVPDIIGGDRIEAADHQSRARRIGLDYGPLFQGITTIERSDEALLARLSLPEAVRADDAYYCHPGILDLCFQALISHPALSALAARGLAMLPVALGRLRWSPAAGLAVRCAAWIRGRGPQSLNADFVLLDADNQPVARIDDARFRLAALTPTTHRLPRWVERRAPKAVPRSLDQQEGVDAPAIRSFDASDDAFLTEIRPLLDAYLVSATHAAWEATFGDQPVTDEVLAGVDDDPRLTAWRHWLAGRLADGDWLKRIDGGWAPGDEPPPPAADAIWQTLLSEAPWLGPELILLAQLADALPALLSQGDASTLEALADRLQQSTHLDRLRQASASVRDRDERCIGALEALACRVDHGPLRALIIGGPGIADDRRLAAAGWQITAIDTPPAGGLTLDDAPEATFHAVVWADDGVPGMARQALVDRLAGHVAPGGRLLVAGVSAAPYWMALMGAAAGAPPEPALMPTTGETEASTAAPDAIDQQGWIQVVRGSDQASQSVSGRWGILAMGAVAAERIERTAAMVQAAGGAVERISALSAIESATLDALIVVFPDAMETLAPEIPLISDAISDVQRLAGWSHPPRLTWLLPGGAPGHDPDGRTVPTHSALWRLGRGVMNEQPALDLQLIDAMGDEAMTTPLLSALTRIDDEREWVIRGGTASVIRVAPDAPAEQAPPPEQGYRLGFELPGQLRNLAWQACDRRAPAAHEVEVGVRAIGLNFRDVMYALGLLGDEIIADGFAGASLGIECAGVVTRVGDGVEDLAPGDAVLGFAPQCFASHVVTPAAAMRPKPDHWSFAEAATVPTVFFTAWYALRDLANLRQGERVLIHGAAGGVGLAAIAIAQDCGATVYATAGSEEKRAVLARLGVDAIYDSRSLRFADEILEATNGEGVDVVLNSLAGEAINRNLRVLRPFGRLLELGKRDFVEDTAIGLRPFRNNLSYYGIDVDQLMAQRPDIAARSFADLMDWMNQTGVGPLPYRVFAADDAVDAFRYMQQARQIGKVVVSLDGPPALPVERPDHAVTIRHNATYLVTGGTAGFGLATARWLLDQGAGRVVAVSRRGADAPEWADTQSALGDQAMRLEVRAGDVSDPDAMTALVNELSAGEQPLRGIIHAAAVTDDRRLTDIDAASVERVAQAKASGAWALHQASAALALDLFVLFSSITTWLGNPGQGNYIAANGYLDGLAAYRRAHGQPATVINWGPIGDTGMLAGREAIRDALASRLGGEPLTADGALEALGETLTEDRSGIAISPLDWYALAETLPLASTPVFSPVRAQAGPARQTQGDGLSALAELPEAEARALMTTWISEEVATVLGLAVERIDPDRPLLELGLDSLMGVELGLALEKRLGTRLPALTLGDGATVDQLVDRMIERLQQDEPSDDETDQLLETLAAQHEGTSVAEAEQRLGLGGDSLQTRRRP